MNPSYQYANQRSKKPFVIIGVVSVLIVIILVTILGGNGAKTGKTDQRLTNYQNDQLSILYPKTFSDIMDDGDYIEFREVGDRAGSDLLSVAITPNVSETIADTMFKNLQTESKESKSFSLEREKLQGIDTITKTSSADDRTNIVVFYFYRTSIIKLTLDYKDGSELDQLSKQIIASLEPAEQVDVNG